jgi:hypothetical protein
MDYLKKILRVGLLKPAIFRLKLTLQPIQLKHKVINKYLNKSAKYSH